jgi:hypothetical protein
MARDSMAFTAGSRSSKSAASSSSRSLGSEPQGQLREVVGADGKAVDNFRNSSARMALLGTFAHHDHLQLVLAALQAMLGEQLRDTVGLAQRAHERHHHLHVDQTHLGAHAPQRLALHREGFGELAADVARRATEPSIGFSSSGS